MEKDKYFVFFIVLVTTYLGLFLVPDSAGKFSLAPEEALQGEYWRFGTYQFAHLNLLHLLQNMVAFVFALFIGIELKTKLNFFSGTYLLAGFLAILPFWFFFPFTALGASTAVFSVFGLLALEAQRFKIKPFFVLMLILFVLFLKPVFSWFFCSSCNTIVDVKQSLAHLFGLLFGISLYIPLRKIDTYIEKKKYVLRRS